MTSQQVSYGTGEVLTVERLDRIRADVLAIDPGADDATRIDLLRGLEELKAAAAAAQAELTVDLHASQVAGQAAAGVRAERQGRGVAAQVGLAKRESPTRARRFVGFAQILFTELPHTAAALRTGLTTEYRAMVIARETIHLALADRMTVDADLGPRLEGLGDRAVEAEARRLAYALDPVGAVERASNAAKDRRVGLRPKPDTMAQLSALLPVAQGVAAWAALKIAADTAKAQGDTRTRAQVMADTLVERLTGQARAPQVPITLDVTISEEALLRGGDGPGHVEGYGPVPADLVRAWVADP